MSLDATIWAWKQELSSPEKLVLLCLADRAGEQHLAYPSQKRIALDTCLDLKTVKANIKSLIAKGRIVDTGKRAGHTKSIPVYQLIGVIGREDSPNLEQPQFRTMSKNGLPKIAQISHEDSPNLEGKVAQIRTTESSYRTLKESSSLPTLSPPPKEEREEKNFNSDLEEEEKKKEEFLLLLHKGSRKEMSNHSLAYLQYYLRKVDEAVSRGKVSNREGAYYSYLKNDNDDFYALERQKEYQAQESARRHSEEARKKAIDEREKQKQSQDLEERLDRAKQLFSQQSKEVQERYFKIVRRERPWLSECEEFLRDEVELYFLEETESLQS